MVYYYIVYTALQCLTMCFQISRRLVASLWKEESLRTKVGQNIARPLSSVTISIRYYEDSHVHGFYPECVLWCFFKLPHSENDLEHSLQVNGFSPECVLWWIFNSLSVEHALEHFSQVNVVNLFLLIFR